MRQDCVVVTLEQFDRALAAFDTRVVAADRRWESPSPCEGWTARDVVNHNANMNVTYTRLLAGEPGGPLRELASRDWLGGDPVAAYRDTAAQIHDAFHESGALERRVDYVVRLSGRGLLGVRVAEFVVHGWDLARAVGADEHFDDDLAVVSWEEVFLPAADIIAESGAMKPSIHQPANGPMERLLLGTGRKP
jgi:uncharacterized protein (TIGR03086 family)